MYIFNNLFNNQNLKYLYRNNRWEIIASSNINDCSGTNASKNDLGHENNISIIVLCIQRFTISNQT